MSLAVKKAIFGWRIALGLQCILATILIVGMLCLPKTPRFVKVTTSSQLYNDH